MKIPPICLLCKRRFVSSRFRAVSRLRDKWCLKRSPITMTYVNQCFVRLEDDCSRCLASGAKHAEEDYSIIPEHVKFSCRHISDSLTELQMVFPASRALLCCTACEWNYVNEWGRKLILFFYSHSIISYCAPFFGISLPACLPVRLSFTFSTGHGGWLPDAWRVVKSAIKKCAGVPKQLWLMIFSFSFSLFADSITYALKCLQTRLPCSLSSSLVSTVLKCVF